MNTRLNRVIARLLGVALLGGLAAHASPADAPAPGSPPPGSPYGDAPPPGAPASGPAASARPLAPARNARPDFSGVWRHDMTAHGDKPFYILSGDLGDLSIMKPWVATEVRRRQAAFVAGHQIPNTSMLCLPAGIPSFMQEAHDLQIIQTASEVIFLGESDHQVRHVYLNATHPANLLPSWYGHSIGRWEGNTLVIDTIGVSDKTMLDPVGTPHSEALHVVERMSVEKDADHIVDLFTLEDPLALNRPWKYTLHYAKAPELGAVGEYACAENNKDGNGI